MTKIIETTKDKFYQHINFIDTSIFTDTAKHLQTFTDKKTNKIVAKIKFSENPAERGIGENIKYFITQ